MASIVVSAEYLLLVDVYVLRTRHLFPQDVAAGVPRRPCGHRQYVRIIDRMTPCGSLTVEFTLNER